MENSYRAKRQWQFTNLHFVCRFIINQSYRFYPRKIIPLLELLDTLETLQFHNGQVKHVTDKRFSQGNKSSHAILQNSGDCQRRAKKRF